MIVEYDGLRKTVKLIWAAATSLGHQQVTNNQAEFIGLHRVLKKAQEMQWYGLHIVGDSAMILGIMKRRSQPRAKKLLHWHRMARRLADKCRVESWTHHYRSYNKAADWLANYAMDHSVSKVYMSMGEAGEHPLSTSIQDLMQSDVGHWEERRRDEGTLMK